MIASAIVALFAKAFFFVSLLLRYKRYLEPWSHQLPLTHTIGPMGIGPTFESNKLQYHLIRFKICAHGN